MDITAEMLANAQYYIWNGLVGGHFDMINALLERGARIEDIKGCIDWAKQNHVDHMYEALLKYESDGFGASSVQ